MPMPGAYWLAPASSAASAAAMTEAGPSTSGNPWPRLIAPVRTASADISLKTVGGMWARRAAKERSRGFAVGTGPRYPASSGGRARLGSGDVTTDATLAADIDATCRLTGEFTLRSGQVADTYFDKYLFEAQPALLDRVAARMVDLLPEGTELLGGLELG